MAGHKDMAEKVKVEKKIRAKAPAAAGGTGRWIYGFVLLGLAAFVLVAVVGYYFTWAADQPVVRWGMEWHRGLTVANPAGAVGALIGDLLVSRWFGAFGIVVPLMLIVLALRILRYRPVYLQKSLRIAICLLILGSFTCGFLFGTHWGLFGTGAGGALGVAAAEWAVSLIGTAGTALFLLMCWILLAVYINRSTIRVVNKVGAAIADNGVKLGGAVTHSVSDLVAHRREPSAAPARNREEQPPAVPDVEFASEGTDTIAAQAARDGYEDRERDAAAAGRSTDAAAEPVPGLEIDNRLQWQEDEFIVREGERPESWRDGFGLSDPSPAESEATDPAAEDADAAASSPAEGVLLGAGGVLVSDGADDGMKVVVAAQSDALADEDEIEAALYDPTRELSKYQRPPVELLEDHSVGVQVSEEEIHENENQIRQTLDDFGIRIDRIKATIGPTVTLYEIVPSAGVKIARIKSLEDDIALNLKAMSVRIIAPMPGKGTVGIEVPNKNREVVSMYSVVKSLKFQDCRYELPVVLGKNISNETFVIDLAKMPHLLVAGATGTGKSVGLNTIISSLLYKKHPAELKFVMVDPKKVELSLYSKLEKHFLAKMESEDEAILTDTQKVVYTLNSLCCEMQARYDLLRMAEVKKISEYNDKFLHRRLNPRKGHRYLPYIVVVIDEFADMIMTAGKEVEQPIIRLAQLARAVGIHLIIATQRPDVKVITGLIKANFPARIAFRVMQMVDSRTIIDRPGANQLVGNGDMLISLNGELTRLQCAFIDTPEIERITRFIANQKGYPEPYALPDYAPDEGSGAGKSVELGPLDPMFPEIARFVVQNQQGSTSSIQRRFSIGYNRAGRIMDQLEGAGIVGRAEGSKPRDVLIVDVASLERILLESGF